MFLQWKVSTIEIVKYGSVELNWVQKFINAEDMSEGF